MWCNSSRSVFICSVIFMSCACKSWNWIEQNQQCWIILFTITDKFDGVLWWLRSSWSFQWSFLTLLWLRIFALMTWTLKIRNRFRFVFRSASALSLPTTSPSPTTPTRSLAAGTLVYVTRQFRWILTTLFILFSSLFQGFLGLIMHSIFSGTCHT